MLSEELMHAAQHGNLPQLKYELTKLDVVYSTNKMFAAYEKIKMILMALYKPVSGDIYAILVRANARVRSGSIANMQQALTASQFQYYQHMMMRSAFQQAAAQNKMEITDYLLSSPQLKQHVKVQPDMILGAVGLGQLDIVKQMLAAGAPHLSYADMMTSYLPRAASSNSPDMLSFIMQHLDNSIVPDAFKESCKCQALKNVHYLLQHYSIAVAIVVEVINNAMHLNHSGIIIALLKNPKYTPLTDFPLDNILSHACYASDKQLLDTLIIDCKMPYTKKTKSLFSSAIGNTDTLMYAKNLFEKAQLHSDLSKALQSGAKTRKVKI